MRTATGQKVKNLTIDPMKFAEEYWPNVYFYEKQREVIWSVVYNRETVVTAGHQLGKDFVAAFIVLWYFTVHHPVRVITTSVKDDHLRVLWGEIGRYVDSAARPLSTRKGGHLICNHREMRKVVGGEVCKISYMIGLVSEKGEGMAGHHAPYTLLTVDEACHDDKTEVLTDEGWKLFSNVTGKENFLTLCPQTREAAYMSCTAIHSSYRDGPMYLYERRGANFCVTPNHKMLWKKQRAGCKVPWSEYYLQQISELNGTTRAIPRCFKWVGQSPSHFTIPELQTSRKQYPARFVDMGDWLEFLGWYLSEGNLVYPKGLRGPYAISIAQSDRTTLHEIAGLAERLGFSPYIYYGMNPCVRINERRLARHLSYYGRYSYLKRVPEWVKDMSPHLIERFLLAFKRGDGYDRTSGREIYYTSSRQLANDIQILSFKTGRSSVICKRALVGLPAPNGTSRHDGYVVSRNGAHLDHHIKIKRQYLQVVPYSGYVYCVTVPPHHTLFTRRNGVCMWSGNSGVEDEVFDRSDTWAKKRLIFGNPYPAGNNYFERAVEGGDIPENDVPNFYTST